MEYFCATCQEKHDTRDIAVDLYNICKLVIAPENEEGTLGEVKVKWVDEETMSERISSCFNSAGRNWSSLPAPQRSLEK